MSAVFSLPQMSSVWSEFSTEGDPWEGDGSAGPSCTLGKLIKEQEDDLCGPKPFRPPVGDVGAGGGELAELAGGAGRLAELSGREILALLQGMGDMGLTGN